MTEPSWIPGCLRDEDVLLLLEGGTGKELESLRAHLDACDVCQELVAVATSAEDVLIRDGDTILDRYRVLGELGRGGMGVVYRVHDPKLHRDLAVKVLHSADPSAPLRLEREAQALARLSHPNIVTVFDIGGLHDQVCMVMELVEGASLRAWLERKRAPEEIHRVLRRAGEGLHAAHQAGLVHRDFKPENILVCDDERVKIVDFGLAATDLVSATTPPLLAASLAQSSTLHRLTRTGGTVGTPAYMSPEQFRGVEADARSDQFSFAVCFWEALHGSHPFDATTIGDLRRNIERGPAGITEGLRKGSVTVTLLRALSVDPDARFASMEDLLRELGAEPRSRPRSAHLLVALVALVAVAIGAAFIIATRSTPDDRTPASVNVVSTRAPASASSTPPHASSIEHDAGMRPEPVPGSASVRRAPGMPRAPVTIVTARPATTTSTAPARGPNGAPLIE